VIDQETADLLAKDELEAAMASGWGPHGPDPQRGLVAALHRARGSADFAARQALEARGDDRWDTDMIRARSNCIRRADHPGPHRAQ
jgi:hypothetical protein